MKVLAIYAFLILSFSSQAQTYTRGKKNIGFIAGGGLSATSTDKHFYSGNSGLHFNAGFGMQLYNAFFPSIQYRWMEPVVELASGETAKSPLHSVSIPFLIKYPLLGFYGGKSRRYECKSLGVSIVGGAQYNFNFGNLSYGDHSNNFELVGGFEFLPSRSGGSKSNMGNSLHIDVLYKFSLNSYASIDSRSWYSNQICVQLSLFKFKTYKFSNM